MARIRMPMRSSRRATRNGLADQWKTPGAAHPDHRDEELRATHRRCSLERGRGGVGEAFDAHRQSNDSITRPTSSSSTCKCPRSLDSRSSSGCGRTRRRRCLRTAHGYSAVRAFEVMRLITCGNLDPWLQEAFSRARRRLGVGGGGAGAKLDACCRRWRLSRRISRTLMGAQRRPTVLVRIDDIAGWKPRQLREAYGPRHPLMGNDGGNRRCLLLAFLASIDRRSSTSRRERDQPWFSAETRHLRDGTQLDEPRLRYRLDTGCRPAR